METTSVGASLDQKLLLLETETVFLLVSREKFDKLPESMREGSRRASVELLDTLGWPISEGDKVFFLFLDENAFVRGVKALGETEKYKGREFSGLGASPMSVLSNGSRLGVATLVVNFGSEDGFSIRGGELGDFERLALIERLALLDGLYIAEDQWGFAITLVKDGKNYGLAFLSEEDGQSAIEEVKNDFPNSRLKKNRPGQVARNLRGLAFDGLVIKPASQIQTVLNREEIEVLEYACRRHGFVATSLIGSGGLRRALESCARRMQKS